MKKHSRIERVIAKLIHNARTVKLKDLERDVIQVTETELKDIGEFNTVDSLYQAVFNKPEAPYSFEYDLNRASVGQSILHDGVLFTVLKVDPTTESKTVAIGLANREEYVAKINNVCINTLLLTIR